MLSPRFILLPWSNKVCLHGLVNVLCYSKLYLSYNLEILTIEDLHELQNTIWEARTQWYNIGLGLGLSQGSLEAIQCNNRKCEDCFRDMLSKWLKKAHPRPTWSALAEALESPSVDYSLRLAESDKILLRKLQ